jgi:glutamyl-tRNA reductase
VSDRQREVIESLADALVGQLLAAPTKSLRDAAADDDWTTVHTALQLFDPDFAGSDGPPDFVTEAMVDEMQTEVPDEIPADATASPFDDD